MSCIVFRMTMQIYHSRTPLVKHYGIFLKRLEDFVGRGKSL